MAPAIPMVRAPARDTCATAWFGGGFIVLDSGTHLELKHADGGLLEGSLLCCFCSAKLDSVGRQLHDELLRHRYTLTDLEHQLKLVSDERDGLKSSLAMSHQHAEVSATC